MLISEFKDYVKALPISQIISFYLSLRKRGANHEAICPFHDDSNPSLKVNDQKGIYKCFVCGEAGDSIKFVENFQKINFIEAIKDIAGKLNITLETNSNAKRNPKTLLALKILNSANEIYYKYSQTKSIPEYQSFQKNRLLDESSIQTFQIGFAPDSNILLNYLQKKSQEQNKKTIIDVALEIGVIKKGKYGLYDSFRDRIMFPIKNMMGEVRGFGSRAIQEKQVPKYLNSSESFIFNKRFIAYGLNFAKESIRRKDRIILTEGYMDSIMLHQFGFAESVATMGIAASRELAKKISALTKNVYFAFDNDDAGKKAGHRANKIFMELGVIPKYINLAPHKDPDELLLKEKSVEFIKRIDNSTPLIDLIIERNLKGNYGANTDLKIQALHHIFNEISPLKDDIRAKERVIHAAKNLGLNSSSEEITQSYKTHIATLSNENRPQVVRKVPPPSQEHFKTLNKPSPVEIEIKNNANQPLSKSDRLILRSLLELPKIFQEPEFTEMLDFVTNNNTLEFVNLWEQEISNTTGTFNISQSVENILGVFQFHQDFKNLIYSYLFSSTGFEVDSKEDQDRLKKEVKQNIKKRYLLSKKEDLLAKRKSLTKDSDIQEIDNKINKLLEEYKQFNLN